MCTTSPTDPGALPLCSIKGVRWDAVTNREGNVTYRLFAPHCYAVATAGVVDKQPHDPRFWAFGYFEMKNRWFAELVPACRYVLSQYILWRMKLRATSTRHGAKP